MKLFLLNIFLFSLGFIGLYLISFFMANIASGYFGTSTRYYYNNLFFIVSLIVYIYIFVYLYKHNTLTSFLVSVTSFIFGMFMFAYLFFYSKSNFAYNFKEVIISLFKTK